MDQLIESYEWDIVDNDTTAAHQEYSHRQNQWDSDFRLIQQAVLQLPSRYQEALTLRYFEHKTVREVAIILEKKEGTIKSLLSRGIEKLKKSGAGRNENNNQVFINKNNI